jgi:hypothetical protein
VRNSVGKTPFDVAMDSKADAVAAMLAGLAPDSEGAPSGGNGSDAEVRLRLDYVGHIVLFCFD